MTYGFACARCGVESTAQRPARFCSTACRIAAFRARRAVEHERAAAALAAGLAGDPVQLATGAAAALGVLRPAS